MFKEWLHHDPLMRLHCNFPLLLNSLPPPFPDGFVANAMTLIRKRITYLSNHALRLPMACLDLIRPRNVNGTNVLSILFGVGSHRVSKLDESALCCSYTLIGEIASWESIPHLWNTSY